MKRHRIAFNRDGKTMIAEIYNYILEPLDAGGKHKHQLIYFAKDKDGKRYRVPKSDVLIQSSSRAKKVKPKCKKTKPGRAHIAMNR